MSKITRTLLVNLGDATPFEHGGFMIYDVLQDGEPPYVLACYWEELEEGADEFMVYRFPIEPDVLAELDWVDGCDTGNWAAVAATSGVALDDVRMMATSKDVAQRAEVYRLVGSHHGWENIDSYPETYTRETYENIFPATVGETKTLTY